MYVNDGIRIIISRMLPLISPSTLENALKDCGLKFLTPLAAGINKDGYRHVKGFKRQVIVAYDENVTIPSTLLLTEDGNDHRIFLTTDITCYHCKQVGHVASSNKKEQPHHQTREPQPLNQNQIEPQLSCSQNQIESQPSCSQSQIEFQPSCSQSQI